MRTTMDNLQPASSQSVKEHESNFLGFGVQGLGAQDFGFWGLGLRIWGFGFRGLGLRL